MILNKISLNELRKRIAILPLPKKVGEVKEFDYAGHTFVCESGVKVDCFRMEWKIIEIK